MLFPGQEIVLERPHRPLGALAKLAVDPGAQVAERAQVLLQGHDQRVGRPGTRLQHETRLAIGTIHDIPSVALRYPSAQHGRTPTGERVNRKIFPFHPRRRATPMMRSRGGWSLWPHALWVECDASPILLAATYLRVGD